jgi:hypothetical protein
MDLDTLRIDRTQFSVARLEDRDDSPAYWLPKPVEERLAAIELLRQTFYDYSLAPDFSKFLKLLNSAGVEYLATS